MQKLESHLSIARMELLACYIGSKAAGFVRSAFPMDQPIKTRLFSDSQVTLFRLQNDYAIYKPFVANRLKAIKEMTQVEDWHYISSTENFAADAASRGRNLEDFLHEDRWWEGAPFLINPNHDYSKMNIKNIQLSREMRQFAKTI